MSLADDLFDVNLIWLKHLHNGMQDISLDENVIGKNWLPTNLNSGTCNILLQPSCCHCEQGLPIQLDLSTAILGIVPHPVNDAIFHGFIGIKVFGSANRLLNLFGLMVSVLSQ